MKKDFSYHELVLDENFRSWVLTQQNDEYWKNWVRNNKHYQNEIDKAKEIIIHFQFEKHDFADNEVDQLWERIKSSNKKLSRVRKKNEIISWSIKMAASILLFILATIIISPYFKSEPPNTVSYIIKKNPRGQKSTFLLPDSSLVILNYGSELTYPQSFSTKTRNVKLVGEAFFEIVKNKSRPFTVTAGDLSTTVLGTTFNVSAYPDQNKLSVMLATGKVKISSSTNALSGHSYLLNPGEQLIYEKDKKSIKVSSFDAEVAMAWKDGILLFKEESLQNISWRLEMWFNIDVDLQIKSPDKYHFTGKFKRQTLEHVLEGLSYTMDFNYKIENKRVIIYN